MMARVYNLSFDEYELLEARWLLDFTNVEAVPPFLCIQAINAEGKMVGIAFSKEDVELILKPVIERMGEIE